MEAIATVKTDKKVRCDRLTLDGGTTSQWLAAPSLRSCFCIAIASTVSNWTIEGLLPDGSVVTLGSYAATGESPLFAVSSPRYIGMSMMCGLPIRFVAATPQPANHSLWAVFKS